MKIKIYTATGVLLLLLIFILQNTEVVTLKFLFWQVSLSRALLLMAVFGCGLFLGIVFSTTKSRAKAAVTKKPDETPRNAAR